MDWDNYIINLYEKKRRRIKISCLGKIVVIKFNFKFINIGLEEKMDSEVIGYLLFVLFLRFFD